MVINTLQYDARYTQRHINTLQYDARYTQRHINTLQYDARYTQALTKLITVLSLRHFLLFAGMSAELQSRRPINTLIILNKMQALFQVKLCLYIYAILWPHLAYECKNLIKEDIIK